jgi:restriction system protein
MARKNETIIDVLATLPWWVSVLVAGFAFCTLQYILPSVKTDNLLIQGMVQAGPVMAPWFGFLFLVPVPISLLNSTRKKRLLDNQKDIESIRILPWKQFEELIGEAFRRQGYAVLENEGAGPDGGVDLWLRKNNNRYLVQCKQWKSQKVGVKVVREMYGLVAAHSAAGAIIVISGMFTQEARTFATGKTIDLIEGQQLVAMINSVKKNNSSRVEQVAPSQSKTQEIPKCLSCGAMMVLRTAKKGGNAGQQFWGCSNFPSCKGIRTLS